VRGTRRYRSVGGNRLIQPRGKGAAVSRDTIVSWKTFALFLLFPPLAVLALVFFPITLVVVFWLYYRGKEQVGGGRWVAGE
jgi:hypothetical protein